MRLRPPTVRYATSDETRIFTKDCIEEGKKEGFNFYDYVARYDLTKHEIVINPNRWRTRFAHSKVAILLHELLHGMFGIVPGFDDALDHWSYRLERMG